MSAPKTIVIAGATGVVGRHIIAAAHERGWTIRALTRSVRRHAADHPDVEWHGWNTGPAAREEKLAMRAVKGALEGADAVINLAGSSIADGRMDTPHKRRILGSRVDSTRALAVGYRACAQPPPVWINASAVGYYGDTGEQDVSEEHGLGDLFLSEVCATWEAEARSVLEHDPAPRQVILRIGLVLAKDAPAWEKMLQPIRFGAGGPLGTGRQWWAWIDADDLAEIVCTAIENDAWSGVYNATAPEPARQIEVAKGAAKHLDRPAFIPAPKFALRLALGGAADELLLPSCKALPERLDEAGFEFEYPTLSDELDHLFEDL